MGSRRVVVETKDAGWIVHSREAKTTGFSVFPNAAQYGADLVRGREHRGPPKGTNESRALF